MKKKVLLESSPLELTSEMIKIAREDIGISKKVVYTYGAVHNYTEYKIRYYFRVFDHDNHILEVDMWTMAAVKRARSQPEYRIFIDKENNDYITYDLNNDSWRTAKIDNLTDHTNDNPWNRQYTQANYVSEEESNICNRYFNNSVKKDVKVAVLDYQSAIKADRRVHKYQRIEDEIDDVMNTIPTLPDDFDSFCYDCLPHYIIFQQCQKKQGYCTHCKSIVSNKIIPKHNMSGTCPNCGIDIQYKSYKKQKYLNDISYSSIIQRTTDNRIAYRQFKISRFSYQAAGYIAEPTIFEDTRAIINESNFRWDYMYEYGISTKSGKERWVYPEHRRGHQRYFNSNDFYHKSIVYIKNIDNVLRDTSLKYMPVKNILEYLGNTKVSALGMLHGLSMFDDFGEKLWKAGFKNFICEIIKKDFSSTLTGTNKEAPNPMQMLKLPTKEYYKQALRIDASDCQIRILQKVSEIGVSITDEQLVWISEYLGVSELINYFNRHTPHRFIKYLKGLGIDKVDANTRREIASDYYDYLDMAGRLGYNISDRSVAFPQNMTRAHDEAAQLIKERNDELERLDKLEKDRVMRKHAKDIGKVFDYEDDNFTIVVPKCYKDFQKERDEQHNCVVTYYERAVKAELIILFIRKKENIKHSFCTVEIRKEGTKFKIWQNRSAYNKDAPPEAVKFMNKAVSEAQKKVDKLLEARIQVAV